MKYFLSFLVLILLPVSAMATTDLGYIDTNDINDVTPLSNAAQLNPSLYNRWWICYPPSDEIRCSNQNANQAVHVRLCDIKATDYSSAPDFIGRLVKRTNCGGSTPYCYNGACQANDPNLDTSSCVPSGGQCVAGTNDDQCMSRDFTPNQLGNGCQPGFLCCVTRTTTIVPTQPPATVTANPTQPANTNPQSCYNASNRKCTETDFGVWKTNYRQTVPAGTRGDFNSNGKADEFDFVMWLKNI